MKNLFTQKGRGETAVLPSPSHIPSHLLCLDRPSLSVDGLPLPPFSSSACCYPLSFSLLYLSPFILPSSLSSSSPSRHVSSVRFIVLRVFLLFQDTSPLTPFSRLRARFFTISSCIIFTISI